MHYRGGAVSGDRHFGAHATANVQTHRQTLMPNEYLCAAGGRFGNLCDNLWFTTNLGNTYQFGGSGGSPVTFDTTYAKQPLILALGAGMGGHVHHIKCFFMDLAKVDPEAAFTH